MKRSSTEARACDAFEDCGIVNIIHLKVDIIESIRDNLTHTALNSEPTKQPFLSALTTQQTQGQKSIPKPGPLCHMRPAIHLTQNLSRIEF